MQENQKLEKEPSFCGDSKSEIRTSRTEQRKWSSTTLNMAYKFSKQMFQFHLQKHMKLYSTEIKPNDINDCLIT